MTNELYLCVAAKHVEEIHTFSSRVMQWDSQTLIFDLTPCLHYWKKQADQHKQTVYEHLYLKCQQDSSSEYQGSISMAFSSHPWRALLLWCNMKERNLKGALFSWESFGYKILTETNWSTYDTVCTILAAHKANFSPQHRRHSQSYHSHKKSFAISRQRLSLSSMKQLAGVGYDSLHARFSAFIATTITWTLEEIEDPTLHQFWPWIEAKREEKVMTHTTLEHSMHRWQEIAPVLRSSLDQLLKQPSWNQHNLVTEIQWELIFDNGENHTLYLKYRYPHPLNLENKSHSTTLGLAEHMFEAFFSLPEQRERNDTPIILGWNLTLESWIRKRSQQQGLFSSTANDSLEKQLTTLCNSLSIPLKRFEYQEDLNPESSYKTSSFTSKAPLTATNNALAKSLEITAYYRPLYCFQRPSAVQHIIKGNLEFLEEISPKWWHQSLENRGLYFYRYRGKRGKQHWLSYNPQHKKWTQHGIFA